MAGDVREVDDVVAENTGVDASSKPRWQVREEERVWLRVGGDE